MNENINFGNTYENTVELILCVTAGWTGAHRFYRGDFAYGLLFLFSFGILGIGWLFDCVWVFSRFVQGSFDEGLYFNDIETRKFQQMHIEKHFCMLSRLEPRDKECSIRFNEGNLVILESLRTNKHPIVAVRPYYPNLDEQPDIIGYLDYESSKFIGPRLEIGKNVIAQFFDTAHEKDSDGKIISYKRIIVNVERTTQKERRKTKRIIRQIKRQGKKEMVSL